MPGNPFTVPGTVEGMVTKAVALLAASRAWPVGGVEGMTKAIPERSNKFLGLEKKGKAGGGNGSQPVSSMRIWDAQRC